MEYKSVELRSKGNILLALYNIIKDVFDLFNAIEDSDNSKDFLERFACLHTDVDEIVLDRETNRFIRYKLIKYVPDNIEYLIIYK